MGVLDKIIVSFFVFGLKTKRIARSAVSGKLNYQAKLLAPYFLGTIIFAWAIFALTV